MVIATTNERTTNTPCTIYLYSKFKDLNKIPSTQLISNLWIEMTNCKWYSQRNDQTLVISPIEQWLSLDIPLFTWKTILMINLVK